MVASVSVSDRKKLEAFEQKIVQLIQKTAPRKMTLELRETTVNGKVIKSLAGVPIVLPSWHLSDSELMISAYPQSIRARLTQTTDTPQFVKLPTVAKRLAADKPLALLTIDSKQCFEFLYPLLSTGAALGSQEISKQLRRMDVETDTDIIPLIPSMAIGRHLRHATYAVRRTPSSVQLVSHQSYPDLGIVSGLPVISLGLLTNQQNSRHGNSERRLERAEREFEQVERPDGRPE
jgi:hypothetical protein